MRAREIFSEAWRNVATGTTRALLFDKTASSNWKVVWHLPPPLSWRWRL